MIKKYTSYIILMVWFFSISSCGSLPKENLTSNDGNQNIENIEILTALLGKNLSKGGYTELNKRIGTLIEEPAKDSIYIFLDKYSNKLKKQLPELNIQRIKHSIIITFDAYNAFEFTHNESKLNNHFKKVIDKATNILKKIPNINILIIGHTDKRGKEGYNIVVSRKRAFAVTNYLREKNIEPEYISTHWFGESQQITTNKNAKARAKNRRINLVIVPNEKMKEEVKEKTKS